MTRALSIMWIITTSFFLNVDMQSQECKKHGQTLPHCDSTAKIQSGSDQIDEVFELLPGENKSKTINSIYSMEYQFAQKPKMGTGILKIKLNPLPSLQDSSILITGQSDMPSMRGAHDSGEKRFKRNKKGEYLLPIDFVMPGAWEIKLRISEKDKIIHRSRIEVKI